MQFENNTVSKQPAHSPGPSLSAYIITKTCLFKYTEIFPPKNENFQIRISDIFHISTQNVDCGYSLEPPLRGGSNEYPQSMFLSRKKEK